MSTNSFMKKFSVNKSNSINYVRAFLSEGKIKINKTVKYLEIEEDKLLDFLNEVEK